MHFLGTRQWPDTGAVVMALYPTAKVLQGTISDNAGGAIVCWQEGNGGYSIKAQRINPSGSIIWSADGPMVSPFGWNVNPLVVTDGNGGAIVAWEDSANGVRQVDILAQRINQAGALQWGTSPVPVVTATNEQNYFSMAARVNGGATIVWTDARGWTGQANDSVGLDIYGQSLDSNGTRFNPDGVPVSNPVAPVFSLTAQAFPAVTVGSGGSVIAVWQDSRNPGNSGDIYGQGVSAILPNSISNSISQPNTPYAFNLGTTALLTANYSAVGTVSTMTVDAFIGLPPAGLAKALPRYMDLSANGSGYSATLAFNYTDLEVQTAGLVNGDANLKLYRNDGTGWVLQGGIVDTAANTVTISGVTSFSRWGMRDPQDTVVSGARTDIEIPSSFHLSQNYPNPFNPSTTIEYKLPTRGRVSINIYNSVGQHVKTLVEGKLEGPGSYRVTWDGRNDMGNPVSSGAYFYRISSGGQVQTAKMLMLK